MENCLLFTPLPLSGQVARQSAAQVEILAGSLRISTVWVLIHLAGLAGLGG
jgi:hypothetical protein